MLLSKNIFDFHISQMLVFFPAKKIIATIALLTVTFIVSKAQQRNSTDTIIPNQTIEIIQNYKPEITKPEKPEWVPQLNRVDTSSPTLTYDVPQQSLSYAYHSIPIRPLALGRAEQKLPFGNYIKLGYGNLNSLLIDGGAAIVKKDQYEAAIHLHHLSQKGNLLNQQSSVISVDASGKYYLNNHVLNAGIDFSNRAFNYYGYNHDAYTFEKNDIHQSFVDIGVHAGLANTASNSWHLFYQPEVSFNAYTDKYNAAEKGFSVGLPFQWQHDSAFMVMLGFQGDFTQFKNDSANNSNNVFQVKPALHFNLKSLLLHIGGNPTWSRDWKFSLMPDIYLKLHTPDSKFALKAGWKGEIIQNTYQELSTKNPYLYNIYPQQQTNFNQVYGGFEAAFGNHLSLNATLSWRQWKGLPLFVNDFSRSVDGKYFTVSNDSNVNALALNADARYQFAEKFSIGVSGAWTNFLDLKNNDKAWMEPMLRFSGRFDWQVVPSFHIHASVDFWDEMYARLNNGEAKKLSSFLDMSAGAEYNIIPRISLFLQANNIFGAKYQRWYQYPVYGFNIIGGVRVRF